MSQTTKKSITRSNPWFYFITYQIFWICQGT